MALSDHAQTKTIGGVTYVCTPVPFGVGKRGLIKLINLIAPIFAAASRGGVGGILQALPAILDDGEIEYFAELFGGQCTFMREDGATPAPLKLFRSLLCNPLSTRLLDDVCKSLTTTFTRKSFERERATSPSLPTTS